MRETVIVNRVAKIETLVVVLLPPVVSISTFPKFTKCIAKNILFLIVDELTFQMRFRDKLVE